MSLDAIHFAYQNKISSDEAIKSFRKFNPASKYVLVSDGVLVETKCLHYLALNQALEESRV